MAGFTGQTTQYGSSVKWTAVTAWAANTAYTVGNLRRQNATPGVNQERVFVCTIAGTSHATTEPLWSTPAGGNTTNPGRGSVWTDGTVTWVEVTGQAAVNGDLVHTPSWLTGAKSTTPAVGHLITDNAGTHIFICTTSGAAGTGAEPSWSTGAVGNTTVDASATWTYIGTSFANWGAPHKTITTQTGALGSINPATNPMTPTWFFVGHDHAESNAVAVSTFGSYPGTEAAQVSILCVNTAGSVPPVAADLATTATVTTTGTVGISLNGAVKICYGITFSCGTSSNVSMATCADAFKKFYHTCNFQFGTNTNNGLTSNSAQADEEFENCTIKFIGTATTWAPKGRVVWRNSTLFDAAGTYITTGICSTGNACDMTIIGCDISGLGSSKTLFGVASTLFNGTLIDCKLPATFTFVANANLTTLLQRFRMIRCATAGNDYTSQADDIYGEYLTEATAARTGGAANATPTSFSWKATTTTKATLGNPFNLPPIAHYNSTTGADVTATIYGIINAAAVPNSDEIFADFEYLGASGNPQASVKSTRAVGDFIAAVGAVTADTSAWDGVATARANTHAYVIGDMIKLGTNAGRLFFCTTAGTSSGSEPGGYASAVDGGSVTDGTAVFRAGCRFKLSKVLTSPQPQLKGTVNAYVRCAKLSTTWYIDPYLALA